MVWRVLLGAYCVGSHDHFLRFLTCVQWFFKSLITKQLTLCGTQWSEVENYNLPKLCLYFPFISIFDTGGRGGKRVVKAFFLYFSVIQKVCKGVLEGSYGGSVQIGLPHTVFVWIRIVIGKVFFAASLRQHPSLRGKKHPAIWLCLSVSRIGSSPVRIRVERVK